MCAACSHIVDGNRGGGGDIAGRGSEWQRLQERGLLPVGSYANVVVFDPHTIADRATDAPITLQ